MMLALMLFCTVHGRYVQPRTAAVIRTADLLGIRGRWIRDTYCARGHGHTLWVRDGFVQLTEV